MICIILRSTFINTLTVFLFKLFILDFERNILVHEKNKVELKDVSSLKKTLVYGKILIYVRYLD